MSDIQQLETELAETKAKLAQAHDLLWRMVSLSDRVASAGENIARESKTLQAIDKDLLRDLGAVLAENRQLHAERVAAKG